ncbi:restriction endonuclease subunit R [Phormidium sp. LEGE 05292]|uniref:type I restriction endonuclease n=1 Tax=[Phormidium] sp. LEGE 05292 TaxID=767427 RepID=UPI00187E2A45|nr:type I restriction endonuclease [Phormidium sp. LEGE 05292]MBE9227867.1 restriction endonuclease subunit R [Phormidium sp. LEGE 05292]
MVEIIPAQTIELHDLIEKFGLQRIEDEQFFREWQENLPELTDVEKQALDEVKRDYFHLAEYPMLEPIVKMVVLSPLLKLAGFYRSPFYLSAEKEVRIAFEDEGVTITGRLDILVFTPEFWILVVESKRAKLSLENGIPQALAYMLGNPNPEKPAFGFVTNGSEFIFLKLTKEDAPKYAESFLFSLRRGDDLYTVLRVLKRLAQLFSPPGVQTPG